MTRVWEGQGGANDRPARDNPAPACPPVGGGYPTHITPGCGRSHTARRPLVLPYERTGRVYNGGTSS
jgi:hypothetical protein